MVKLDLSVVECPNCLYSGCFQWVDVEESIIRCAQCGREYRRGGGYFL
jgi:hypothetical protein